jgi:hypothetical protein
MKDDDVKTRLPILKRSGWGRKILFSLALQGLYSVILYFILWWNMASNKGSGDDHLEDWVMLIWLVLVIFGEIPMWLIYTLPSVFIIPKINPNWAAYALFVVVSVLFGWLPVSRLLTHPNTGKWDLILIEWTYHALLSVLFIWRCSHGRWWPEKK